MKNWKTTVAGIAAVLGVVAKVVSSGHMDAADIGAFTAGVGLIMAKDHNVTGGNVEQ